MILRWLGHAAFSLQCEQTRLCLDPHAPGVVGGRFHLPAIEGPYDAVVVSHPHEDHHAWRPILGTTHIVDTDQRVGELEISFRAVAHDSVGGAAMGWSRMVRIRDRHGATLVHCGDIGAWSQQDVLWLQDADVVLMPVGGNFTLNPDLAAELCRQIGPRMIVPMHAQDPMVDLALASTDDFVRQLQWTSERLDQLTIAANCREARIISLRRDL
ncbi:MAG TPA: hypothetical protein DCQ06_05575 [Myxococcales bacterium]|nr:hypothetical protein [Myxococcales bacterium]HAN31049.1 hypothetical protein [Myxococcales bacterium]